MLALGKHCSVSYGLDGISIKKGGRETKNDNERQSGRKRRKWMSDK